MKSLALVVYALTASTGQVAPSDLLTGADVPAGLELAVEPPADLTFDEYAPLSPDATAHVDPTGSAALSMRAAVDVWTSAADDILLREITRWSTADEARAFVEQAVVVGTEDGLDAVDPPFDGGVAFLGSDEGLWTRTVAWQQGPFAMTIAHFGVSEGSDRIIDGSATELADHTTALTGHPIAVFDEVEPTSASTSDGGIGIGTVVLWIVVIGGVTSLIIRLRRRAMSRDEPRARHEVGRRIDAIPDPAEPGRTPPEDR